MKLKLYQTFLLLAVLFISSSFKHPIKLTSSLIEYNAKTNSIKMECRVFIDDFEKSINKTLSKDINIESLTNEDKVGIENYFKLFYTISINGKKIPLKYKASEVRRENNMLAIKFLENDLTIEKGDYLLIENTLFFQEFGDVQSNNISIIIPPFLVEYNYQATLNNYSYTHTF